MHLASLSAVGARIVQQPKVDGNTDRPRLQTVLVALNIAAAIIYIVAFVVPALFRLTYPFPLETIESASQAQVDRVLSGRPLFYQPTLEGVPLIYGPVSFYLAAVITWLTGTVFIPLRLVSLLASCASLAIVFWLVRRETGSATAGLLAAGLLAACNPLVENNMDLGRVDSLFTFFLVAAIALVRFATTHPSSRTWIPLAGGGIALGLAACTKVPMGAAPVAIAVCIYLAATGARRIIPFVVALGLTVGLILVLLRLQSGPWPTWFMIDLPGDHRLGRDLMGRFWIADTLPRFTLPLVILGPVFVLSRLLRGDRMTPLFYGLICLTLIGTAWPSRANGGGAQNVLLPAYLGIALLFGLGFDQLRREIGGATERARAYQALVVLLTLVQFVIVVYNPRYAIPDRSQLVADQHLAARLASLPEPIFAPDTGGYLRGSSDAVQPHLGAVDELVGGYGGPMTAEGDDWQKALDRRLAEKYFRAVVLLKTDCCLKTSMREYGYSNVGALMPAGDDFYLWRAPWTPDLELYLPPSS